MLLLYRMELSNKKHGHKENLCISYSGWVMNTHRKIVLVHRIILFSITTDVIVIGTYWCDVRVVRWRHFNNLQQNFVIQHKTTQRLVINFHDEAVWECKNFMCSYWLRFSIKGNGNLWYCFLILTWRRLMSSAVLNVQLQLTQNCCLTMSGIKNHYTGRIRLIWSVSSGRFSIKLSANPNYNVNLFIDVWWSH